MLQIITRVLREKNEPDAKIIGISLIAHEEAPSKYFIKRFFEALHQKRASPQNKATIKIINNKVVFEGPGFRGYRTKFEFEPKPEELDGLKTSIFSQIHKRD